MPPRSLIVQRSVKSRTSIKIQTKTSMMKMSASKHVSIIIINYLPRAIVLLPLNFSLPSSVVSKTV